MSDTRPLFSIIIPFKAPNPDLDEALEHIFRLAETGFEVILLPDASMDGAMGPFLRPEVVIIPTGPVSPAIKRDRGAEAARGDYLAFIDDDAYPDPAWLTVAKLALAADPDLVAVGGPASTPRADPFWSRVSGAVYLSRFSGGFPERYLPTPPGRFVDDWPSVNLIVRRDAFLAVGGFDSAFWPGEDTKLCMDLVRKTGGRIRYLPELLVWHHRRPGLKKHLRQVGNYGLHRGHFARRYPETSRRPRYFAPSAWLLFLVLGLLIFPRSTLYALGLAAYAAVLLLALGDIARHETPLVALAAAPYIVLTHLWYGAKFLRGFFSPSLTSSLGR